MPSDISTRNSCCCRWRTEIVEHQGGELLEHRTDVGDRLGEEPGQLLGLVLVRGRDQGVEQRLFALKVVVERAFADAHDGGDVAEAGAEVALLGKQLERRVEDRLSRLSPIGVNRTSHLN